MALFVFVYDIELHDFSRKYLSVEKYLYIDYRYTIHICVTITTGLKFKLRRSSNQISLFILYNNVIGRACVVDTIPFIVTKGLYCNVVTLEPQPR